MTTHRAPSIIDHSVAAAHVWYHDVAAALDTDDEQYAARALRAVLHTLRDRLTVVEAAQLAAQLPTLIRGVFYENWRPDAARHLAHDVDAFLQQVASEARMAGETEASLAVEAVASVLHQHVSEGELADVLAVLPAKLRPLFERRAGQGAP
jgi:uncharacterized protein (DUF2267 family)